jgi:outer membrane protein TolC
MRAPSGRTNRCGLSILRLGRNRTNASLRVQNSEVKTMGGVRSPLLVALAALLLAGCKTFSPDGGFSMVAATAGDQLGKDVAVIRTEQDEIAARSAVAQLLRRPLSAEAAVQVALLNNRGLQAAYNELGISEAALVGAYLPPNPTISIERLASGVERELEVRVIGNILALLTLPARAQIAEARFQQAQLRAIEETLRVAAEARRAFYRAVSAREIADFLTQSKNAAETATQLARRLGETGAMNKLDQAREQVFYADIAAQLAVQQQRALSEREQLIRALGLWNEQTGFRLPSSTPPLPARVRALPDIEVAAVRRRVDLEVARIELDAVARSYGLTNATRFLSLLELAGISKKIAKDRGERENPRGFEVELQVPLFDFGEVRVRQAKETYLQAVNRLAQKAIDVRSEARDAYRRFRSTYEIARHYRNEVLPLRKIISEETLLRYNAMQIDVFDLLAEARQRISATIAAIEAQRDFWLASADLMGATIGGGRTTTDVATRVPSVAASESGGH